MAPIVQGSRYLAYYPLNIDRVQPSGKTYEEGQGHEAAIHLDHLSVVWSNETSS